MNGNYIIYIYGWVTLKTAISSVMCQFSPEARTRFLGGKRTAKVEFWTINSTFKSENTGLCQFRVFRHFSKDNQALVYVKSKMIFKPMDAPLNF